MEIPHDALEKRLKKIEEDASFNSDLESEAGVRAFCEIARQLSRIADCLEEGVDKKRS